MTGTVIVNFYPIAKFIICLFAVVGLFSFLNNLSHIVGNAYMVKSFLKKFPDVLPEFMRKPLREQNIENNQEIHEINKRLAEIEKRLGNG